MRSSARCRGRAIRWKQAHFNRDGAGLFRLLELEDDLRVTIKAVDATSDIVSRTTASLVFAEADDRGADH